MASILSISSLWELVEKAGTVIVILGCIGEYIADFSKISKCEEAREKLGKQSTVILIIGLAMELVGGFEMARAPGRAVLLSKAFSIVGLPMTAAASTDADNDFVEIFIGTKPFR